MWLQVYSAGLFNAQRQCMKPRNFIVSFWFSQCNRLILFSFNLNLLCCVVDLFTFYNNKQHRLTWKKMLLQCADLFDVRPPIENRPLQFTLNYLFYNKIVAWFSFVLSLFWSSCWMCYLIFVLDAFFLWTVLPSMGRLQTKCISVVARIA